MAGDYSGFLQGGIAAGNIAQRQSEVAQNSVLQQAKLELDKAQLQREDAKLEMLKQEMNFNQSASILKQQFEQEKFKQDQANFMKEYGLRKEQLSLQDKQITGNLGLGYSQLGLETAKTGIQQEQFGQELGIKQALAGSTIDTNKAQVDKLNYEMNPMSTENQLRKAQTFNQLALGEAALRTDSGTKTKDKWGQENNLRSDFLNQNKDYFQVADSFNRIKASAKDPSAAGDLALVFNYMKMLDPGSTVREGEFATAQNSGSIPSIILARYNKVISGERLAPEQRTDFVNRAGSLYQAQREGFDKKKEQFTSIANRQGLDPSNIAIDVDYSAKTGSTSSKLSPADIAYTAKQNNMTEAQVMEELKKRGKI